MNEWEASYAAAVKRAEAAEIEARRRQALLDAAPRMLEVLEMVERVFYHTHADATVTAPDGMVVNLSALIREARGENV